MSKSSEVIPAGEAVSIVEVEKFLRLIAQDGPWRLTAIPPDGKPTSDTFTDIKDAVAYAVKHDGSANVYFQANSPRDSVKATKSKLAKDDMARGDRLWADFDPAPLPDTIDRKDSAAVEAHWAKERDRLLTEAGSRIAKAKLPSPSTTILSGGGVQCSWLLDEPYDLTDLAQRAEHEHLNQQIAKRLGADDSVWNVDRLLRVAGTMNLPDVKKREEDGRIPARAKLMPGSSGAARARQDFLKVLGSPQAGSPKPTGTSTSVAPWVDATATPLKDIAELERWNVPPLCAQVIVHGHDPENPLRWPSKKNPNIADKSAAVWHVVCELARREVPDGIVLGILTDERWPISAHVRVQKVGADRYARDQLRKAKVAVSGEARKQAATAKGYITDDHGNLLKDARNVAPALNELGVTLSYDAFADKTLTTGVPGFADGELDDARQRRLQMAVLEKCGLRLGKDVFVDAVLDLARYQTFHPVKDYLDSLTWDGTPRIDNWLIKYAGAADTELNRAFGRIVLIAAVRRVRQPGAKFDELLTLIGDQGAGKSTLIAVLAVREQWFTDDLRLDADSKEVLEVTAGKWFVEYGELTGLRKADRDKVKSKLSRRAEKARKAFERFAPDVPRQWIAIGTTNDRKFLNDHTGNRRYWPAEVGNIDLDALHADVHQLWAEAAVREAAGESIRLDPSLYDDVRKLQDERLEEPPMLEDLEHHLGREKPGWIASVDAWKLAGKRPGMKRRQDQIDFGAAMRALGFDNKGGRAVFRSEGKVTPGWYRGTIGAHETSRIKVIENRLAGDIASVTFPDAQMSLDEAEDVSVTPFGPSVQAYLADAGAGFLSEEDDGIRVSVH
jgi:hypothetical protein